MRHRAGSWEGKYVQMLNVGGDKMAEKAGDQGQN